MLRCDNALLAVADPELQTALNLFFLSGRTHRVTLPAPTTAAGSADASQVSEAKTQLYPFPRHWEIPMLNIFKG